MKDPGIARATSGGGVGGYKRVYRYQARNVRDQGESEESNLEPGIVMGELIEVQGKKAIVRPRNMCTILVKIHQSEQV